MVWSRVMRSGWRGSPGSGVPWCCPWCSGSARCIGVVGRWRGGASRKSALGDMDGGQWRGALAKMRQHGDDEVWRRVRRW